MTIKDAITEDNGPKSNDKKNGAHKAEQAEKILHMKLNAVNNYDSIFILPTGTEGFAMAFMARQADRMMTAVKRKFGTKFKLKEAKAIFVDFDAFAQELWEFVYKICPNLSHVEPKDWRKCNDERKEKEAIAHRRSSFVIEPRSEESAKLAMAVKIVQRKNIELRNTSSFEDLEKFYKAYVGKISKLDNLLVEMSKKTDMPYKSKLSS